MYYPRYLDTVYAVSVISKCSRYIVRIIWRLQIRYPCCLENSDAFYVLSEHLNTLSVLSGHCPCYPDTTDTLSALSVG